MKVNIKLINRCLSNDRIAQNELYRELLPYLNMIAKRYLYAQDQRQDVLQEAFLRIFRHLSQFDVQYSNFKTWATKITINCCLQHNNRNKKRIAIESTLSKQEVLITPAALSNLSNEDVLRWLQKMPKPYFEVFNLHVIDGFSHQEIASILGIKEALSRQRLARSRAWIKQRLPDEFRSKFRATFN